MENALAYLEKKPQTYEKLLQEVLQQVRVSQDEQIIKVVQALLVVADPIGTVQNKYIVSFSGGQGNQVGDNNPQNNYHDMPSPKH